MQFRCIAGQLLIEYVSESSHYLPSQFFETTHATSQERGEQVRAEECILRSKMKQLVSQMAVPYNYKQQL